MYQELKAQGTSVCENTVARLMKDNGIRSVVKRRFRVRTTDSAHAYPIAPNRLERQFEQDLPDQAWAADLSYVSTAGGPAVPGDRRVIAGLQRLPNRQEDALDPTRKSQLRDARGCGDLTECPPPVYRGVLEGKNVATEPLRTTQIDTESLNPIHPRPSA